jgi:hypothetical protein
VNLLRGSVAECRVETLRIVAELDVPGDVFPRMFACGVDGSVDSLNFQRGVEGLGERIIET